MMQHRAQLTRNIKVGIIIIVSYAHVVTVLQLFVEINCLPILGGNRYSNTTFKHNIFRGKLSLTCY